MNCTETSLPHNAELHWADERRAPRLAILLGFCLVLAPRVMSQGGITIQSGGGQTTYPIPAGPDSVRGTVINGKTHEPIAKALVYTPDNRYAVLTDDEGHFEFKFPPRDKSRPPDPGPSADAEAYRKFQQWERRNTRPGTVMARKPGFLSEGGGVRVMETGAERAEIVIPLQPEALIVGHVQLPGVDSTDRIQLQIYRQDFDDGQEKWNEAGYVTTWASGEFRFSELPAGTYKLLTVERTERDPVIFNPGNQLYGFPPVFYPNADDFSSATPIKLTAGATFQANLRVTRREYYPVKIGVANPPAAGYPRVEVYLRSHPGPGYSLGYDSAEQVVRGFLPDGGYTLDVFKQMEDGWSGSVNFAVRGRPVEGQVVTLYPNVSLGVNITRGYTSIGSVGGAGGGSNIDGDTWGRNVTVGLWPTEQFAMRQAVIAQPAPSDSDFGFVLNNVAAGTYWLRISANDCYVAAAMRGEAEVLHHSLTVGAEGAGAPIEVTLRNDGAEVVGRVQLPEYASPLKPGPGAAAVPQVFVYIVPLGETAGPQRRVDVPQDGVFDETQIAPGTYRILAFDNPIPQLDPANTELLHKFEVIGKGVVVELSPKQTLRLPSPLALVSEP